MDEDEEKLKEEVRYRYVLDNIMEEDVCFTVFTPVLGVSVR
jgi:hypothetical protein